MASGHVNRIILCNFNDLSNHFWKNPRPDPARNRPDIAPLRRARALFRGRARGRAF
jgi:hypothetical protein